MRTKTASVKRRNIEEIRKDGLSLVYQARAKAVKLNAGTSVLKKIASLEKAILTAKIDRSRPGTFLKTEISNVENIINELDMRAATFMRRNQWKVSLAVLPFKFVVFLGFYLSSISISTYKINPAFYNVLGCVIYLFLIVIL